MLFNYLVCSMYSFYIRSAMDYASFLNSYFSGCGFSMCCLAAVMISVCHAILLHLLKLSIISAENQQTYGGWDINMKSDPTGK
jgi:hypothetical protein